MRKGVKRLLIIALILVVGGGVLAGAAWGLGAETDLHWDRGFQLSSRVEHVFSEALADFDQIDLRVGVTNITLQEGDAFHIEGRHNRQVDFGVQNGVLRVESQDRRGFSLFNFNIGFGTNHGSNWMTITVPYGTELDAVNMYTGVGDIRIDGVTTYTAAVESGVGSVRFEQVTIHDANVESGVGDIRFTGNLTGISRFDSGVGNLTIGITNGNVLDFSYFVDSGVGSVAVAGARSSGLGGSMTQNLPDPTGTIHASSGVGDITLDFQETQGGSRQ